MGEITGKGIDYFLTDYHTDLESLINHAVVAVEEWVDKKGIPLGATFIFDIDDTLLSTVGHKLGWSTDRMLPPLEPTVQFYHFIRDLGFETVLLTGREEIGRNWTINNLAKEGILDYEKLILRSPIEVPMSPDQYKSRRRKQLVERDGLCIVGNIGDQITDLIGEYAGELKIKIPYPGDVT